MIHVGRMYAGYMHSPAQALPWFLRAAQAGLTESYIWLADLYLPQPARGGSLRLCHPRTHGGHPRPRPTTQPRDGHLVTIEGLLVELFIERRALHLMDEGEYFRMFANLAGHSRVSLAGVLDYAWERRPAGLHLIQHIKAEFLQNSALVSSSQAPALLAPDNAHPE